ncbi:MAG: hypothetical protein OXI63_22825, partial [Candidatus Poribacteria bacterium]|nr:hypothetical protein [Candidatus Poribacteria bacterium]
MNERNDLVQTDNSEMASAPLQPMSLVDILDGMFSLYRSHFQLFFGIVVVYFVLGFAVNLISVATAIDAVPSTAIIMSILTTVVGALVAFLVVAGLAYASETAYLRKDKTSKAALKHAWRTF